MLQNKSQTLTIRQTSLRRKKHSKRDNITSSLPKYYWFLFLVSFAVTNIVFQSLLLVGTTTTSSGLNIATPFQQPPRRSLDYYSSLPGQVVLTNYGWNHPDPRISQQIGRTQFQAYLHQGIIRHSWYNPTGWTDQERLVTTTSDGQQQQRIYVFLDLETCYEENYPNYGWGLTANSDTEDGRQYIASSGGQIRHMKNVCPIINKVLDEEPLFQSKPSNAILVLFDCGWRGPPKWSCLNRSHNPKLALHNVSIVSESASFLEGQTPRSKFDLGLPPPAIHPVRLNKRQHELDLACDYKERPLLFTFTGNFRHSVRQALQKLHDPAAGILVQHHFGGSWNTSSLGRGVLKQFENVNGQYTKLLSQSRFAGVPRGDNLFSYRFTEALSGGCIPVVYADGWVLPFSRALVHWEDLAVIIPERDAGKTLDYLGNLTMEDECAMRNRGYDFYQRYMSTSVGVISGIIESLERLNKRNQQHR